MKNITKILSHSYSTLIIYFGLYLFLKGIILLKERLSNYTTVNWDLVTPSSIVDQNLVNHNKVMPVLSTRDADLIVQHQFKSSQKLLLERLKSYDGKVFLTLPFNNLVANKKMLWLTLVNYYGISSAERLIPRCYTFPEDLSLYQQLGNHSPGNPSMDPWMDPFHWHIVKTNSQRQEGLYLTKKRISNYHIKKLEIILAQRYLDHPYLYRGHKVNLRYYLTIRLDKKGITSSLSRDGIVTYTPKPYKQPDKDSGLEYHIASFYLNKELYQKGFPIIISDFLREVKLKQVWKKCNRIVKQVDRALEKALVARLKEEKVDLHWNVCYEMFGVDFFLNDKGRPYLIEYNIGPGLTPFNHIDKEMRSKVINKFIYKVMMDTRGGVTATTQ